MLGYLGDVLVIVAMIGVFYLSARLSTNPTPVDKQRAEMEKYLIF
ncbi:MAG: hypothetical protein Q8R40_03860 [bacterium]|nr:hypothetical protein [bacterium]